MWHKTGRVWHSFCFPQETSWCCLKSKLNRILYNWLHSHVQHFTICIQVVNNPVLCLRKSAGFFANCKLYRINRKAIFPITSNSQQSITAINMAFFFHLNYLLDDHIHALCLCAAYLDFALLHSQSHAYTKTIVIDQIKSVISGLWV